MPGDNDIGGEEDMVSSHIHERFNYAYTQPDTLVYSSATFFKVQLNCLFVTFSRSRIRISNTHQCIFPGQQIDKNDACCSKRSLPK